MTSASEQLTELVERHWAASMRFTPTEGHLLGYYPRGSGSFEDVSRRAEDVEITRLRAVAEDAEGIGPEGLDDQERVTRDVVVTTASDQADLLASRLTEIAADPLFGTLAQGPLVLGMLTLPDAEVAEAMVGVLEGIGQHFRDLGERHREGLGHGWAPADFAARATLEQAEAALAVPLDDDPFVAAFRRPEQGLDADAWRARLRDAVERELRPGLEAYAEVLRDRVLPEARPDDRCGLSWLDGGEDAYARTLRYYTTTDRDARSIHETGLAQVERLEGEYRALGAEALGTDDLDEVLQRMRSDPALRFETGDQLVEASRTAMARANEAAGDWFAVLPQAPCAVESTTAGAKAFYFPPSTDGSRGGTFFVNVADPTSWGTFELEAMAFHEGVPGHHLQLAISSELADLPALRTLQVHHAYAEGWGLYSERLADEMGLYSSPTDRLGMLAADSMRACRLAVDTGLHALGWSRQQAVDYMLAHSPLSEGVVRPEIDRYVVMPGQATSYMVGRLEIQRLRHEAEQRRGGRLDIKDFHSAVLDSGSLPLDVLTRVVEARLP